MVKPLYEATKGPDTEPLANWRPPYQVPGFAPWLLRVNPELTHSCLQTLDKVYAHRSDLTDTGHRKS